MGSAAKAQTVPSRFQGKPVKTTPRNISAAVQAAAKARMRGQPGGASRAASAGRMVKAPSGSASAGTAMGTSHQKRSTSVRIALVSQCRPATWKPQPQNRPIQAARRALGAAAAMMSSAGRVASRMGTKWTGGSASAATAPSAKARDSARQKPRPSR